MRALYIFPGARKGLPHEVAMPDTQLYGYNHLRSLGINAEAVGRDDALPNWLRNTLLGKWIGFKMRHALLYFKARNYDIVFGPTLIYLMPFKKLFGGKAKYVVLNIELVRIARGSRKHPFRVRLIESLFREFSAIVCLSTAQKDQLVAQYPFLADKVFFVPLGADTTFFSPVYETRGPAVLSVGKDIGRDYRTLIDTARLMPDTNFEIVCHPRNMTSITDIPSNVQIHYNLPFSELVHKYQTAAMIVLPTHADTSAEGADCSGQTVLLDAMASGLPVIATHKAYLSDYATEGKDILVVPPQEPRALVEAIRSLQNRARGHELARSARRRMEQCTTSLMAERLLEVFVLSR